MHGDAGVTSVRGLWSVGSKEMPARWMIGGAEREQEHGWEGAWVRGECERACMCICTMQLCQHA